MLIAIPCEGNMVCPHFGHCEVFAMYDTDTKAINSLPNPGHEPGYLPRFLKEHGVNLVIAGGMGGRAQELFAASGIDLIVGVSGSLKDVLASFDKGELKSTGAVCSEHSHAGDCHN
jgi:predicted Fe-Mo cluster-binding NifX family protein